jgi:predicted metal-dependent phosphoesterase TrpH
VVQRAHEAGLAAIALTDHDTLAGVAPAVTEGTRLGLRVVSGCEFSVQAPWGEMHLLGYFLPPDSPAVADFLAAARTMRLERALQIVDHLQAWGVDIGPEDVLREAGDAAVGRPHVARALVRRGTVPDVVAAFDEFLGEGRRAYVPKRLPPLEEVAALVHRVGGMVAAAHLRERATRTTLLTLKRLGLDGVEVRHPRHSPELARAIESLARELDLVCTGGTDWHGDGDADHGEPLGACAVPLDWLTEMEQRARRLASTPCVVNSRPD